MKDTQTENEIKIFLASSSELELERAHVGDLFNDINSILMETNTRIRLLKWESFDPSFKGNRKQSEYDEQVKKAYIFIVLYRSIAGKYTQEEVDTAITNHEQNNKPEELYCFIQDYQEQRSFDVDELKTKLGRFYTMDSFVDIKELKLKLLRIISPRISACGVTVNETEKFIQIHSVNVLRK